jgi:hypothetical protein
MGSPAAPRGCALTPPGIVAARRCAQTAAIHQSSVVSQLAPTLAPFAQAQRGPRPTRGPARAGVGRARQMVGMHDERAPGQAPAGRSPRTTSRSAARGFPSSTGVGATHDWRSAALSLQLCQGQLGGQCAWRRSRGPGGDPRNNPCRRQGDQVVAPGSTGRRLLVEGRPRPPRDVDAREVAAPAPLEWRERRSGRRRSGRVSSCGRRSAARGSFALPCERPGSPPRAWPRRPRRR